MPFNAREGAARLIKEQVVLFFEVDARTIERYLEKYGKKNFVICIPKPKENQMLLSEQGKTES